MIKKNIAREFSPEIQKLYDTFAGNGSIPMDSVALMARLACDIIPLLDATSANLIMQTLHQMVRLIGKEGDLEGGSELIRECIEAGNHDLMAQEVEKLFHLLEGNAVQAVSMTLVRKAMEMERYDIIIRHMERRMSFEPYSSFINEINDPKDGAKRVVFIARRPFFQILREAMYLRKNNWRIFLIYLEDVETDFTIGFDATLKIPNHILFLDKFIERMNVDVFHVQSLMWDYGLSVSAIRAERGKACVVCEFYDITSVYAPRDALAGNWSAETVDLDLAMEKTIFQESDAVITRFPKPVHKELLRQHEGKARVMEFWPYPCSEFTFYSERKASQTDDVVRLVYAGGLIPQNDDHPGSLFPERRQPSTYKCLLDQGLGLVVYGAPHQKASENRNIYEDFFKLAEEYPGFKLLKGVAPQNLAQCLALYDFGIILCEMDLDELVCGELQMKWGLGTKMLTYLEAGLPVIVNAEYEYMAEIVEADNLGFAVRSDEIGAVGERIKAFDYERSVACIRHFNKVHGMDREIARLEALYEEVSGSGTGG